MSSKNLFLFLGADRNTLLKELKKWQQAFIAKYGENDIEILDPETEIKKLLQITQTPSLFSTKRLIIIHDFLDYNQKELGKNEDFLKKISQTPEENLLVFVESKPLDKRLKFSKDLLKIVQLKEFNFTNYKTTTPLNIDKHLLEDLISHFKDHEQLLGKELEKLSTYTLDNQKITKETIDNIINFPSHASVFALTDVLFSSQKANKIRLLNNLHDSGEDIYRLIYLLANQTRLMLLCHLTKGTFSDLAELKIHPFVQKKLQSQMHQTTFKQIINLHKKFTELDHKIKTGKIKTGKGHEQEVIFALELIFLNV